MTVVLLRAEVNRNFRGFGPFLQNPFHSHSIDEIHRCIAKITYIFNLFFSSFGEYAMELLRARCRLLSSEFEFNEIILWSESPLQRMLVHS